MLLVHVLDLGPLYVFKPLVLDNLLMIHSILLSPANESVETLTFPLEQEAQKWTLSDLKPNMVMHALTLHISICTIQSVQATAGAGRFLCGKW